MKTVIKNVNLMIQYCVGTKLEGLICCHADSFFWGETKDFEDSVISKLKENLLTCSEEIENFKYLDLYLVKKENRVYLG